MKNIAILATVAAVVASASTQGYDRITIHDNEVIPVKFDSNINAKTSRRGDRFTAKVDGDRILPNGTKLIGRVLDISRKENGRRASAELAFEQIEMPNGQRVEIDAYPIALDNKNVSRERGGRMEAKKETRRDHVVIGGTVGGLILGSLIKKPFEGAVIGALGGILVAETDALNTSGELIVQKGQKMGAAFDREVVIDWRDGDRYGRDDEYRRDDETRRDEDRGDVGNGRRDDQNRNGEDILVEFQERALRFDDRRMPYRNGSTVMVPLAETAAQLDLKVQRTAEGVYYIEDEENTLKLEQNKSDARLNGKRIELPKAIVLTDGVTYVPIEAFAAVKQDSIYVNGTRVARQA